MSAIDQLVSMGFEKSLSERALNRTNGDVSHAVELLSSGKVDAPMEEFDLLAAGEPEPEVREATVHKNIDHSSRVHEGGEDPFKAGIDGTPQVSQMVDSRIATFTEMGFSVEQAEGALKACDNDVNAALNMLTESA
jgi:uncharacterized UBP type Zn finger protein